MLISLDYDKTYTKDPILWDDFITQARLNGHKIICLTMRHYKTEKIENMPVDEIIYTSRQAKLKFAEANGIDVDIWIDDKPAWLFEDAN